MFKLARDFEGNGVYVILKGNYRSEKEALDNADVDDIIVNIGEYQKPKPNTFQIKGRKIDALELLGMLEDSDSQTKWAVKEVKP